MRLDECENVAEQWRRFQVRERVDESVVRPVILRSWKRCLQMNVNPDGVAKVNIDPGLLGMRLEKNTELVSVAEKHHGKAVQSHQYLEQSYFTG